MTRPRRAPSPNARHPRRHRSLWTAVALALVIAGCGGEELPTEAQQSYALSAAVEQWRKLVEKHFRRQHVTWALNIIRCESGGNPNAYNASSGASGLFQHLKRYWAPRAAAAGFSGKSPFHAEANIAASAMLLYAPGGGPSHWSCKFSPFANNNYEPKFFDHGVPVKRCTPHCSGDVMVDDQCGEGDCSKYGARCVDDALGLRCVFSLCPARGDKRVCLTKRKVIDCHDGKISEPTDCGDEAYCSAAGAEAARCVSKSCVASPEQAPIAHDTCLPDGRLAACSGAGVLKEGRSCPAGQSCVMDGPSARCALPDATAPAEEPPPAQGTPSAVPEESPPTEVPPAGDETSPEGEAAAGQVPGILPESYDIEGVGCAVPPAQATTAPPWSALALAFACCAVRAWPRRRKRGNPRAGTAPRR